ncbi:MAG: hypothetical protein IV085_07420 [Thiobacillus sp.]|nr:hypothetical protein [Thiobacillus sp.]
MIRLPASLKAWNTPQFRRTLQDEIEALDHHLLPLQRGLARSSQVTERPVQVMVISETETAHAIIVNVGVFYTGVIAGCNCADDPTPIDEQNEYCVIELVIDKRTAETEIGLIPD